ncbi:MAG: transporter permease [Geminicoccaceae bacterium]|jgi:polar amino acid transport system permease protein|nr:transporter permease [Geminicoccaceae bacterium]
MLREFTINEVWYLVFAARWTLALTAIAFLGGGLVGLLVMVLRVLPIKPVNWLAIVYIQAIQGTPLLGQLFLFYFGLSIFGYDVSPWVAAGAALSIYASGFLAEIWRGCVQAVPRTQWEASAALGLSFLEQLRHVILPQALRIAIPPTVGFLVQVVKNTSLASAIGFVELTRAGQIVNGATFQPFVVYVTVALIYFAICFPLSLWSQRLERRLHVAR